MRHPSSRLTQNQPTRYLHYCFIFIAYLTKSVYKTIGQILSTSRERFDSLEASPLPDIPRGVHERIVCREAYAGNVAVVRGAGTPRSFHFQSESQRGVPFPSAGT